MGIDSEFYRSRTKAGRCAERLDCNLPVLCHALVIEDDPVIAAHIALIASGSDVTSVDIVASPAEALASARNQVPSFILSDVQIVDGSGPEAGAQIRGCLGNVIPVIFITASPEACAGVQSATVLVKPVTPGRVAEAIAATGCI